MCIYTRLFFALFAALLVLIGTASQQGIDAQEGETASFSASGNGSIITFHIEHALDVLHSNFTTRTKIQLMVKPDGRQGLKYLDRNTIVGDDLEKFRQLVEQNGVYTIRIRAEKVEWQGHFITSSLPVCELQKTGFKEDIGVFLSDFGNVVGIDYRVPKMTIAMDCNPSKIKGTLTFQTRISISEEQQSQPLPMQLNSGKPQFLQNVKLNEGIEEKSSLEQKQNQSFLSRYWYIVVGLVLYMFVGGAEPPKDTKQQAHAQKDSDGASTASAGAPVSSTQSSSAPSSSSSRAKKD